MKKLLTIITLGLMIFIGMSVDNTQEVGASTVAYQSGIGYGINVVTSDFADSSDIRIGSPILNTTYLQGVVLNRVNLYTSDSTTKSNSSFKNIAYSLNSEYGFSASIPVTYGAFIGSVSAGYEAATSYQYSSYASQYYYTKQLEVERYSLSLPNYSSNLTAYQNNLHPNFEYYLGRVKSGYMSYSSFFDIYGTHVIANGIYGGRCDMYYSLLSNQVDFSTSVRSAITAEINGSIGGFGSTSASTNFSLSSVSGLSTANTELGFSVSAKGGNPFDITNQSDFSSNYSSWMASIPSNEVLVNFGSDGLIPIWEFIPNTQEYFGLSYNMENAFEDYLQSHDNNVDGNYSNVVTFGNTFTTDLKTIRTARYQIDDDGRYENPFDEINIGEEFGISIEVMKSQGYETVDIHITLLVAEKNDGYQYIWAYKSLEENDGEALDGTQFEHGSGYKKTSYSTHTFDFNNIDLDEFLENEFFMRYGASGSWADDWYNKYLKIELTFEK